MQKGIARYFMRKGILPFGSLIIVILAISSGCRTPQTYPNGLNVAPANLSSVVLKSGDEVEIKFFFTPQLDVRQVIRPDGKIQLQLIGEVPVAGKTPEDLRSELLVLYERHLKEPDVAVIVRNIDNQRVFVSGEVARPGVIPIPGNMTALDAIIQAGGFNVPQAEIRNVIIIRQESGKPKGYSINLRPILYEGVETEPFILQPQDVVYVPATRITRVDRWIDQYLSFIKRTNFSLQHELGRRTSIGLRPSPGD